MNHFLSDVRFAARMLLKKPLWAFVAISTLALGIGANTVIFSLVNGVLLKPLPYRDADRLVMVWGYNSQIGHESASLPDFVDWRSQNNVFEEMAAFVGWTPILTEKGEPRRLSGSRVSSGFFPSLQVQPLKGRVFSPEEDRPGRAPVVLISDRFWKNILSEDPTVIGQKIILNGNPSEIIGVMPASYRHPESRPRLGLNMPDVWAPLAMDPVKAGRRSDFLRVIGRLKPGVSVAQAQADMNAITGRLAEQYPDSNANWSAEVLPITEEFVGKVRQALLVLFAAVGFVLLIACTNVANLLLTRSAGRKREIAVRTALGAGRFRLFTQFLTESALVGILGGGLGLVLAFSGLDLLLSVLPGDLPRLEEVTLDGRVLLFALVLSLLAGLVFGLLPLLQLSGRDPSSSLREGGRSAGEGSQGRRLRNILVVVEVAMAFALLFGAGLMMKSFSRLQDVDAGFEGHNVLTFSISLPSAGYDKDPIIRTFFSDLIEKLDGLPNVESVGGVTDIPLGGGGNYWSFAIQGRPLPGNDVVQDAEVHSATDGYFSTLKIPLIRGRLFSSQDDDRSPRVVLINQTMAARYWPGQDPVGARITFGDTSADNWLTIIGVVGDVRHIGLDSEAYPQVYASQLQSPRRSLVLALATNTDPSQLAPSVREAVWSLDDRLAVPDFQTLDDVRSGSVALPRFRTVLLGLFALLALILAMIGLYGVMAYAVAQRSDEIGIRMAMGARRSDILSMVIRQGLKLVFIGLVIGVGLSLALGKSISSLLFEVAETDLLTFVVISTLFLVVALAACYLPAWRASKTDPMRALRYE